MKGFSDLTDLLAFIFSLSFILRLLFAVVVLLMGAWLSDLTFRAIKRASRRDYPVNLVIFLSGLGRFGVMIVFILISMAILGVPIYLVASIFMTLLVASAITIRIPVPSLAAGILLNFVRPFNIGDEIQCHNEQGIVRAIRLLFVRLERADQTHVQVPCDFFFAHTTVNLSRASKNSRQADAS